MFRFTIRDVLWLTVVVALAVGWFLDRSIVQVRLADLQWQRDAALLLGEAAGYQWEVSREKVYLYHRGAVLDLDDGQWIGSRMQALRNQSYPRPRVIYEPLESRRGPANSAADEE